MEMPRTKKCLDESLQMKSLDLLHRLMTTGSKIFEGGDNEQLRKLSQLGASLIKGKKYFETVSNMGYKSPKLDKILVQYHE